MEFYYKCVLSLLILLLYHLVKGQDQHLVPATLLSEGCIDETCLKYLAKDGRRVSQCFDPLRATVTFDDFTGLNICCAVRKYESCIFPLIIANCGLDSMDKFEEEMRSVNAICSLTTLSWIKCEPKNQTTPEEIGLELREQN